MRIVTGQLTTAAATGAAILPAFRNDSGGVLGVTAYGTFGGGTLAVQLSHDGTNFGGLRLANAAVAHTADFSTTFHIPPGLYVRLVLTGSTGATVNYSIASDGA